ncbi:MAG: carboxypeptidase-like regulatory domain-containing protein [Planctomycetota bacterium]|nr:carboxypeptidase-like regulatory domain-containing protein [Planctomycetota bacterium]
MRLARFATIGLLCLAGAAVLRADSKQPTKILVLGPAGRPLPEARLLVASATVEGRPVFDPTAEVLATADARGRLDDWVAEAAGGARLVVWTPGTAATLVPRDMTVATVRLLPALATEGTVRMPAGAPAADRTVFALPVDRGADLVHRARTDKSGGYRLPALHAGDWDLYLRHATGRLQRIGRIRAGGRVGALRVRASTSITGRLLDADGTRGAAVAGAKLRFVPVREQTGGEPPEPVTTAEDGTFFAGGLEDGVYRVELVDADWAFEPQAPRVQAEEGRAREIETWFALRRQAVTGTVVGDREQPVEGAAVRLLVDPTSPPPPGTRGASQADVKTDEAGLFRIDRVAPGEGYRLVVSAPGFSPWVSNPFRVDRGEPTKLDPVRLRAGWRVFVRLRDLDGDPIAGARVRAVAAHRPTSAGDAALATLARDGTSDAAGRLELTDLPADDVLLTVDAPGYLPAYDVVSYPRVADFRNAELTLQQARTLAGKVLPAEGGPRGPFVIRASRRDGQGTAETTTEEDGAFRFADLADTATDVSVHLEEQRDGHPLAVVENVLPGVEEHLEIQLPELRTVRGRVEELRLEGVPAEVVLETRRFDADTSRYVWRLAARAAIEQDGTSGRFELAGVPPGLYALRAVQGTLDTGTVGVLLADVDVEDLELRMPSGARIAGSVLDAESKPLLGARVILTRWQGEDPAPLRAPDALQRVSDERGDFLFEGVAPGLWRVEAADLERASDVAFVRVRDGEVRVVRDLMLGEGGELAGVVEDADGRPLDGVDVRVQRFDGDAPLQVVRSDHEGRFRARNLRPGIYRLLVHVQTVAGGPWTEAVAEVESGRTTDVRFTAADDGALEGTLRRRGKPVPGAVVDLVHTPEGAGPLRRYRTGTDAEGRFAVAQLEAGRYEVRVQSGAWRSEQDVWLEPGDRIELDLEAYEGRLRGTVVTAAGDPVPAALVVARPLTEEGAADPDAGFHAEVRADPSGAFVLRGLPVGSYSLAVSAPGHPPGLLEVAEADLPGADFPVEVVLGRGGDIRLRVVDENDRGVTGALVWVEDTGGSALHRTAYVTGAAGRLVIEGVPAGEVRLRVRARGLGRPALRSARVEEGRQTDVEIQVGPAGALRLVVTGEGSDPVGRARIDLVRAGTGDVLASRRPLSPIRLAAPWGVVPRTGVVVIPDLEAGDYIARISAGRTYAPAEVPVRIETGETAEVGVVLQPR